MSITLVKRQISNLENKGKFMILATANTTYKDYCGTIYYVSRQYTAAAAKIGAKLRGKRNRVDIGIWDILGGREED